MENNNSNLAVKPELPVLAKGIQKMALSFSGGGFRAASFSLGCVSFLHYLPYEDGNLLDKVKFISSTSGGSFTNLMLCCYTRKGKDFEYVFDGLTAFMTACNLLDKVFVLLNDDSVWAGKLKSRNLINAFAMVHDLSLFKGATLSTLSQHPQLVGYVVNETCINTTEFDNGLNFRFGTKGLIGNKFLHFRKDKQSLGVAGRIKLGDILACSSCFPGGFEPLMFPEDLTYTGLTKEELTAAIVQNNQYSGMENNRQENNLVNFGFMDGGIDDNQGIYSFLTADERVDGDYDCYFTCDVTSPFLQSPFDFPRELTTRFFKNTIPQLKRNILTYIKWYILFGVLTLIAGIVMSNCVFTRSAGLLLSGVAFTALLLPYLAYYFGKRQLADLIGSIIPRGASGQKTDAWKSVFERYQKDLLNIPLSRLIAMLGARISSVLLLTVTVFLKKIRRISYDYLYAEKANAVYEDLIKQANEKTAALPLDPGALWKDHIGVTTVYLLSTKNDFMLKKILSQTRLQGQTVSRTDGRLITELLYKIALKLRPVVDVATEMGTTLWFDEKQVRENTMQKIIVTGEATMCFNLMVMVYQFGNTDSAWIALKARLVEAWERFGVDPFWMYAKAPQ